MNQQNKQLGKITIVDDEHGAEGNGAAGNLLDSNNPVLQPPKERDARKKKTWKRKLIGWSVMLLLIGAGVGALYLLMRVQRVNVTVNADSRRHTQSSKPQTEATNSDSAVTAEAINLARKEAGVDANSQPVNSPSPVPSPAPSPEPTQERKVDFSGNSPVFDHIGKTGDADSNSQTNGGSAQARTGAPAVVEPQSHANPTQSLFVDDAVMKYTPALPPAPVQTSRESKPAVPAIVKPASPTVPPFGTMLPVRTQGVMFTACGATD